MAGSSGKDFFISYTAVNRPWAEWIVVELERAHYSTVLQAWDFWPGSDFVHEMQLATSSAGRTIAVLSPTYFGSQFGEAEWRTAFVKDPSGELGLLVPVRVQPCEPLGLLAGRVYVDLVDVDELQARQRLLAAVDRGRPRPTTARFPGTAGMVGEPGEGQVRFPGSGPSVSNLPARNRNFTGRDDHLARLHAHLLARSAGVLPAGAVHGLGGVGKTQLAVEYAHRFGSDYDMIWWIPAEHPTSVVAGLAELARQVGVPQAADQADMVAGLFEKLRRRDRWLLIYDNAEKPDDLARWLPSAGGGHVLITSRRPDWSILAEPIHLGVLEHDKAVELLLRRGRGDDPVAAAALADELGDLPLALEQAAAYIETEGMPLAVYLEAFRRLLGQLLSKGRAIAYEGQLDTTWQLSIDKVAPEGVELLRLCAFLAPEAIPLDLFAGHPALLPPALRAAVEVDPTIGVYEAAGACYRYSLVDRDRTGIRVHRLVQQVVRTRLAKSDRQAANNTVVELLAAAFPDAIDDLANPGFWPRCAELLPHLLTAAGHAEQTEAAGVRTANLLRRAGSYLERRGDYRAARGLLESAVAMVEAARGTDHVEVAYALNALGYLLHAQPDPDPGDLAVARSHHERALRISQIARRQRDGSIAPNLDEDIARTLNNLGHVLYLQGNLSEAHDTLEQGLAASKEALGAEHPEVATALNHLGLLYRAQGKLGDARTAHKQALAIKEAHSDFGPDSVSAARTLCLLAGVLQDQGDSAGALEHLKRAHTIFQATLGPEHPATQAVVRQLANQ